MCERCQDPNKTDTQEYTVHKGSSKRKATLCKDCARTYLDADIKLTGGKAPEAEPSAPESAVKDVTEPTEESVVNDKPAASSSRRGYGSTR